MKLQKRLGRKYKEKNYYKWVVILPDDEIITAGFKEGDELRALASDGKITITKD